MATTIWSYKGQAQLPPEDRVLALKIAPVVYGVNAVIYLGFGLTQGGSKVMNAAFGEAGTLTMTSVIGGSALLALFSLLFLRFQLERLGAIIMVAGLVSYLSILLFSMGGGNSPVSAMAGTLISAIVGMVKVRAISRRIAREKRA